MYISTPSPSPLRTDAHISPPPLPWRTPAPPPPHPLPYEHQVPLPRPCAQPPPPPPPRPPALTHILLCHPATPPSRTSCYAPLPPRPHAHLAMLPRPPALTHILLCPPAPPPSCTSCYAPPPPRPHAHLARRAADERALAHRQAQHVAAPPQRPPAVHVHVRAPRGRQVLGQEGVEGARADEADAAAAALVRRGQARLAGNAPDGLLVKGAWVSRFRVLGF